MATLIDNKIDLAFISETWLSSQSNSVTAQIKMYGYELIHAFRDKRGGGVGILWKNSIKNHVRFSSVKNNFDTFQYQMLEFPLKRNTLTSSRVPLIFKGTLPKSQLPQSHSARFAF